LKACRSVNNRNFLSEVSVGSPMLHDKLSDGRIRAFLNGGIRAV
jgi:hypothetical protein